MASQDAFDPHTFLAHVGAGRTLATHRRQSPIFAQGDVADAVFYIQRGQVKLTVVSARGKEAVIAILEAQAFFDCALMRIEKSAMLHVLHAEPAFAALCTAYLLSRNRRIAADLIEHLFNASEQRLAQVLLLLAHFGKDGQTELVLPKISQDTLAEMVGTTRSRALGFSQEE
jgi:CRP/FNR family transcriptional regulator, cyclic AMP receptor protein